MITTLVLISTFAPLVLIGIYIIVFNGLQSSKVRVEQAWAGIEVQLKRRHDLVPGLVSSVKSAMKHENEIFERLIAARENAMAVTASGDREAIAGAEAVLSSALSGLQLRMEDNPEITANNNIKTLQKQLEETEDQIAASRRLYNGNVQALNGKIITFPGNMIASRHQIDNADFFALKEEEKAKVYAMPNVSLEG